MKKQTKFKRCAEIVGYEWSDHGKDPVWDHDFGAAVARLAHKKYDLNAALVEDEWAFREGLSLYFYGDTSRA